jgi:hypothetical protein
MVKKTTERFLGSNLQYCLHASKIQQIFFDFFQPIFDDIKWFSRYFIQIYPVCEGYLGKIPVERRGNFHELGFLFSTNDKVDFSKANLNGEKNH